MKVILVEIIDVSYYSSGGFDDRGAVWSLVGVEVVVIWQ